MLPSAQLTAQGQPVVAGHHDIQHHQVYRLFIEHGAHLFAISGTGSAIARLQQIIDDQLANIPVVINDKNVIGCLHPKLLFISNAPKIA